MGRKISFEEFVTKCDEQYNNRFYYFGCTFTSMKDHVHMFDKEKQIFTKQIASRHYLGELPRASRTITFQEFLVKMEGFFGDRFTFSEDSFDSGTHSLVKFEDKLGNKYEYIASYLLKGRLPPEINPRAKGKKSHNSYTTEGVKDIIRNNNPHIDHIDLSLLQYVDQYTEFQLRCTIHDYVYPSTLGRARRNNCPKCAKEIAAVNCRKGDQYYLDKFKVVHNDKYTYEEQEIYSEGDVWAVCPVHDYRFKVNVNRHLLGVGCPKCSSAKTTSKGEKAFVDWLKSIQSNLILENYKPGWLRFDGNRTKELDVYIPELNLAIEYNGAYYHSVEFNSKFKDYHQKKYNICKEHSINLIHIFEFENLNKWKKKIANYLRNPDMYTIAYSNCKRSVKGYTCYGQSYIKRTY